MSAIIDYKIAGKDRKMKPIIKETSLKKLFDFEGKVTIITGAGGLGETLAVGFAEQKAIVILMDIVEKSCVATVEKVRATGYEAKYILTDVTNADSVNASVQKVVEEYGRIDILLHTAGVTRNKHCLDFTDEEIDFILKVNLNGTIYMNQAVGRVMKEQKYGKIVDIGSIGGLLSHMDQSMPYEASKAAVHQIVRSFANELAPYNINVNSIAPFWINTPMIAHQPPEYFERVFALTSFGRCLEPEELLGVAYFLTSDASNFVTGQVIAVDGGYSTIKSMHALS